MYRACPNFSRVPLGNSHELIYCPLTRSTHTLESADVLLLQTCNTFATLDDHALRAGAQLRLEKENVRRRLESLARIGLLVSHQALTDRCLKHAVDNCDTHPQIASMGIPTRNRPDHLERCVTSYAQCANAHARKLDFVIVDSSEEPATRECNLEVLSGIKKKFGTEIRYIGLPEKEEFAGLLIERTGLPPGVVRFALLPGDNYSFDLGGNRNALLLSTIGDLTVQVDDDTVCSLLPRAACRGLTLTSKYNPTEFWFPENDEALSEEERTEEDFFALHEQLLGRSVGSCVEQYAAGNPIFAEVGADFFRRLEPGGGKVFMTALGVYGDSGMGSSTYFLKLDGDSRDRLLRSGSVYQNVLARHQIIRAATGLTITDGSYCMGLNLGIDNRGFIPPFIPVQRNEDGILLRPCVRVMRGTTSAFFPLLFIIRVPVLACGNTHAGGRQD